MSTVEITVALKVQMLKHLIADHDLDWVAAVTKIPRNIILDVVAAHGYPDKDRMGWAVDVLTKDGNQPPERPAHTGFKSLERATPVRPSAPANAQSAVQRVPVHTSTAELLHQAAESRMARTRSLGAKISGLLTDLTARLAEEQETREELAKAEKDKARVGARIAELEAEIAKLKGKNKKPATVSKPRGVVEPRPAGGIPCPSCDRTFQTGHGLDVHKGRSHQAAVAS